MIKSYVLWFRYSVHEEEYIFYLIYDTDVFFSFAEKIVRLIAYFRSDEWSDFDLRFYEKKKKKKDTIACDIF